MWRQQVSYLALYFLKILQHCNIPLPGGILAQLLNYGRKKLTSSLTKRLQKIKKGMIVPLEWNTFYIYSIYKKRRTISVTIIEGYMSSQ